MWRRLLRHTTLLALLAASPVAASPIVRGPSGDEAAARRVAILNFYASAPSPAASVGVAGLCDRAIRNAAARHDVPLKLMRAVALVESGKSVKTVDGERTRIAWPWTVNMEGEGRWFDDQESAVAYVQAEQRRGARSFDIGCMQVNHLWHGEAFRGVVEMFDPEKNADYAARFLKSLKEEAGDWFVAAGNYHSRTPKFHQVYRAKVKNAAANLPDSGQEIDLGDGSSYGSYASFEHSRRRSLQSRGGVQITIAREPQAPPPPTTRPDPPVDDAPATFAPRRALAAPTRGGRVFMGPSAARNGANTPSRGGVSIRMFAPQGAPHAARNAAEEPAPSN